MPSMLLAQGGILFLGTWRVVLNGIYGNFGMNGTGCSILFVTLPRFISNPERYVCHL